MAEQQSARLIRMNDADNVAIVANDGGLEAGAELPGGIVLRERVPQAHKVSLVDIAAGTAVRRYDVTIGWQRGTFLPVAGCTSDCSKCPKRCRWTACRSPRRSRVRSSRWRGYTFEGYRNPDGSVGTRNLLAITQTVQCVSGIARIAADRIRTELLPLYPNVDGVVALEHTYGCGVAIDAPDAIIPIRNAAPHLAQPEFWWRGDGDQPWLREAAT